jgi:hypothetical protein
MQVQGDGHWVWAWTTSTVHKKQMSKIKTVMDTFSLNDNPPWGTWKVPVLCIKIHRNVRGTYIVK